MRGGKSGSRSQAGQRDGSAAAALSRLPVGLFVRGVRLASAPEARSAEGDGAASAAPSALPPTCIKPSARLTAI